MTEEQKESFKAMQLEDQLVALYDMLSWVRSEFAVIEKNQIGFRQDLTDFTRELREVRARREKMENDSMNTNEKIAAALAKRFDFWIYIRDRVLPSIITMIFIALLYIVFGGQLP